MNRICRFILIGITVLLTVLLCGGCAAVRERLERVFWEHSGVAEDADYLSYQEMLAADQLDPDGTYHSGELESYLDSLEEEPSGTIHVSFARNDYIAVEYYLDEALTQKIDGGSCWMNPGDVIYASEPVVNNPYSNLYQFSHFRIWTHDAFGKLTSLPTDTGPLPGAVYQIPQDFDGTELSVLPLGEYRNRVVHLQGGMLLSDGSFSVLDKGFWKINGKTYGNVTVELSALESFRIVYDYSAYKDELYFVESVPIPYWDKASDGTITFKTDLSDDEELTFTVFLHPYGTLTVLNGVSYQNSLDSFLDGAASVFGNKSVIETKNILELFQVNGVSVPNNFTDTELVVPGLKIGDEVLIRVPGDLKLIAEGFVLPAATLNGSSREYRFRVPESDSMLFSIGVGRRNSDSDGLFPELPLEHGTVSVFDSLGLQYTAGSELPADDEKITVEIVPEADYCIYGKNVKDNVYRAEMKYSDFTAKYHQILRDHPIRPGIIVNLVTEDDLGECEFWTGTTLVSGRVVLREGQDLQFDYILNQDAGYEITLSAEDRMAVSVWNPFSATRELDVDETLNGKTLRCRDFLTLKEGAGVYVENTD